MATDTDFKKDVERIRQMEWLEHRPRFASVLIDFDRHNQYRRHRVVWYLPDKAWLSAEGQSFSEAVDNAMHTVFNEETGEHYVRRPN